MTSPSPAPIRRALGRRSVGLVALVLPLLIGLPACSGPAPTVSSAPNSAPATEGTAAAVPSPGASGAESSAAPSAHAAEPAPSGAAAAVEAALQALLASAPQPSTAQVRESLSAAGFAPAAVEVSASRTPTGLAADAVEVGVLGENECVMAQLRSGTVATSVLPVLPNGRCFIGSVQR